MKKFRLISFYLVLVIAFSAWTPAPVLAKQAEPGFSHGINAKARAPKVQITKMVFINKTGGVLAITMTGKTTNYFITVPNNGRGVLFIKPGRYAGSMISSGTGCPVKPHIFGGIYAKREYTSGPWVCSSRR